ncbi:MAG: hypothetical protein GWN30_17655 [Gammaproteobacteria bacterium]|nr:hypothetical protein [Gammaproteobacteria bacterium]
MYQSYLVRIWCENDKQDASTWAAEVQQIQGGGRWSLSTKEDLMNLLTRLADEVEGECPQQNDSS